MKKIGVRFPAGTLKKTVRFLLLFSLLSWILTWAVTGRPSVCGFRIFWVMTDSMEPVIPAMSPILTVTADPSDIRPGDIAVYTRTAAPKEGSISVSLTGGFSFSVVHRVIRIEDGGQTFIFQGDNEEEEDPPVDASRISYRVILP